MDTRLLIHVGLLWFLVGTRDIPDPGYESMGKCLTAVTGRSLATKSILACDKEQLQLECPGSDVIVFETANYGRTDTDICGHTTVDDCRDFSTVTVLNKLCMGKNKCVVTVDRMSLNSWVCPLVSKYLEATYSCIQENAIYDVCESGDISDLPAYVHSPGYPAYYPNSRHCIVSLSPSLPDGVEATTLDVDLELHDAAGCLDYLVVREQHDSHSKFLYCGDLQSNMRQQRVRMFRTQVEFQSDNEYPYRGFLVKLIKGDVPEPPRPREGSRNPPARRLSAQQRQAALPHAMADESAQATIRLLYFLVMTLASMTVMLFCKMYCPVLDRRLRFKNPGYRVQ